MIRAHRRRTLAASVLTAAVLSSTMAATTGAPAGEPVAATPVARTSPAPRVVLISIDGLNPAALGTLGRAGTPALHRLRSEGASTLNARTEVEQTETLPNHIGMVTSRRITASRGGHGVTWNDERLTPMTVQQASGRRVASVWSVAENRGRSAALFSAKVKFSLMERSWPAGVDHLVIDEDNDAMVEAARQDLLAGNHDFTMVHISLPDRAGHRYGFMSAAYLQAVRESDALVGRLMGAIRGQVSRGGAPTWVVLTADHGGSAGRHSHKDATVLADYRVPFMVWGPDVAAGADLYALSPMLKNPRRTRPGYGGRQPVRNGAAANLVTELLGLPKVPGSTLNYDRALNWK